MNNVSQYQMQGNTEGAVKAQLVKVINGDTIEVIIPEQTLKIHMVGCRCSDENEDKKQYSDGKEFTENLCSGKEILVSHLKDSSGRVPMYIWIDGKILALSLFEKNLAKLEEVPSL